MFFLKTFIKKKLKKKAESVVSIKLVENKMD